MIFFSIIRSKKEKDDHKHLRGTFPGFESQKMFLHCSWTCAENNKKANNNKKKNKNKTRYLCSDVRAGAADSKALRIVSPT